MTETHYFAALQETGVGLFHLKGRLLFSSTVHCSHQWNFACLLNAINPLSKNTWVCYTSKIYIILGRILCLIELLTKILLKPGNWFFRSFDCSIFNIHSSINQVFNGLGIKHICFCKQDNNRNCAEKGKGKFKRLSTVYTPLPVPHSLKKFNSALVIGLASSLIGMQYLHRMYSDAL